MAAQRERKRRRRKRGDNEDELYRNVLQCMNVNVWSR